MVAALIGTVRMGQRSLRDQLLVEQGVRRGFVTAAQVADATVSADPGAVSLALVTRGDLSSTQLKTLTAEVEDLDLLDTLTDSSLPQEVQEAGQEVSRQLGRYVLVSEVGAGGMGVVWRAWDKQLSRWVAVKQIKVKDARLIARFMREATLLAQLAHPNITDVFEVGVHEGRPFLVMELVEGGSPKSAELDRQQAAAVVRDAARAVHYAHERGIIHRDLKPSNLLVDGEPRVFVTDFGLARMREEGTGLTASGAILGTPSFMAPEQAQGRDADHRTDVYGLGATLYALVSGEPPHSGEIVHEVVKRVAVANPPVLDGSDDLVVIVQKAMERDREDRYQSAGELADELDRFLRDEPILARPLNFVQRVARRARRRPLLAASLVTTSLVLATALYIGGARLADYYERSAQIEAAKVPLEQARAASDELKKLYAAEQPVPEWEAQALKNMEARTKEALEAAPGFAEAEFLAGELALWRDQYDTALAAFDRALQDDPAHHQSRVYRLVARYGISPLLAPEIQHDGEGFRIVAPPSSQERQLLLEILKSDLEQIPENYPRRRLAQSVYLSSQGAFQEAYQALAEHLSEHAYDQKVRAQLLWTALAVTAYEEVLDAAELMKARGGFPATAEEVSAYALAGLGQLDDAISAMERAQARQPGLDKAQWIAFWHFKQERFEVAFSGYQEILRQDPDHLQALLGRSTALQQLTAGEPGQLLDQAMRDAQRAAALAPDDAAAQFVLGGAQLFSDPEAARRAYERAIALDPDYYAADANAMIATTFANIGDFQQGAAALDRALALRPEQASWQEMRVRFDLLQGNYAAVAAAAEANPENPALRLLAATSLALLGDEAAALEQARAAAALDPDSTEAWNEVGYFAAVTGAHDAAAEAFARAAERNDRSGTQQAREVAGWFFGGQPERALVVSTALLESELAGPFDIGLHADILGALGRETAARAVLAEGVSRFPDSPVLALRLSLADGDCARAQDAQRRLTAAGRGDEYAQAVNQQCPPP